MVAQQEQALRQSMRNGRQENRSLILQSSEMRGNHWQTTKVRKGRLEQIIMESIAIPTVASRTRGRIKRGTLEWARNIK
jgi:hypothetical protein